MITLDLDERILALCALTNDSLSVSRSQVRIHNSAMRKLHRLKKILYKEEGHGVAVIGALLDHSDERVLLFAASYCLEADLLLERAREVLIAIKQESPNKLHQLNAYMSLMLTPRNDW